MTNCWFCGHEMIWGADFSFEDYGREEDGIVATLSCPNCPTTAEFSLSLEDGENDDVSPRQEEETIADQEKEEVA